MGIRLQNGVCIMFKRRVLALAAVAACASGTFAAAATVPVESFPVYVDSAVDNYALGDGVSFAGLSTSGTNAGYSPNDFGNLAFREKIYTATSPDPADPLTDYWSSSESYSLNNAGFLNGGLQIGYDLNQSGQGRIRMGIIQISVMIDDIVVWELAPNTYDTFERIVLNPDSSECATCEQTQKPLGSGVDAVLYVPTGVIVAAGEAAAGGPVVFTGNSTLTFRWKQSVVSSSAGAEQWALLGTNNPSTTFLQPNDPLTAPQVPLPATAALLPVGLLGLFAVRRRRASA